MLCLDTACSGPVTRRQYTGVQIPQKEKDAFAYMKKHVALLPLFNDSPYGGEDLGINATEELRMELVRTGQFVFDPVGIKLFGTSKEIYARGGIKLEEFARKAKMSGINFVLYGRIVEARVREKTDEIGFMRETKSLAQSKVELRIFDVNSNKEVLGQTFDSYVDDSSFRFFSDSREAQLGQRQDLLRYSAKVTIRKAIPDILSIAAKLEWIGRVAKIIGNKVYVNAGRETGIRIGDVLKVMTEGTDIYDPETGAFLGMSKGIVKGTIEVTDYFGPDGSVAIMHSGGVILEGDYVQLY